MRKLVFAVLVVAAAHPLRAAAQPEPPPPAELRRAPADDVLSDPVTFPPPDPYGEPVPIPGPAPVPVPDPVPVPAPVPVPEPVPVPAPAPTPPVVVAPPVQPIAPPARRSRRWFERLEADDPVFELRNDPFTIAFHGLLQVQFAPFVQDDARRSNGDAADALGFVLRRARLGVDGQLAGEVTYQLQYEFFDGSLDGEGGSRLLDANIGYTRFPLAQLTFGAQKVPFSKVNITSAARQQFVERPFSARQIERFPPLVPDRQLGGVLSGDLAGLATYSVGVFNGNTTLFRGDDNGGLLYVARVELHPLGTTGLSQSAFHQRDEGHRRLRVGLGGDIYYDDGATGGQVAWSVDLTAKWRGLSVTTEFLWSHFEPDSDPVLPPGLTGELDQRAFFAQAGYFLLPGRLELAARVEYWDTNTDADDANDLQVYSGVLNFYLLRDRIKAQLQYTHRREPNSRGELENDTGVLQLQAQF